MRNFVAGFVVVYGRFSEMIIFIFRLFDAALRNRYYY